MEARASRPGLHPLMAKGKQMEAIQRQVQHLQQGDVFAYRGKRYRVDATEQVEAMWMLAVTELQWTGEPKSRLSMPGTQSVRVLQEAKR